MSSSLTRLWVVATPLGNPGDLSPRAREILSRVDCILAEDTRRAGLLLAACSVPHARLVSFHDHNEGKKLAGVLEELKNGATAALISDAGTPLLSDPGFTLVRACREAGLGVSPVPGPSAPVAALSASGIAPLPYAFLGFPPRREREISAFFSPYAYLPLTLVFFERKDRLDATLRAAHAVLGPRRACVARELTKTYEEFIVFRLGDALPGLLGEITVIIGPPEESRTPEHEALDRIREARRAFARDGSGVEGMKPRDMARALQAELTGWSVKEIYNLMQREES